MPGKGYIVTFKPTATKAQIAAYADRISRTGGEVGHRYYETGSIIHGFSAKIPDVQNFEAGDFDGIIENVESDGVVTIQF